MNLIYIPIGTDRKLSRVYQIINSENEEIGMAEGYVNLYGDLVAVIKIFHPAYLNKGIGFAAFKKIYDELNEISSINVIKGSWHSGGEFQDFEDGMSTNLKVFNSCYELEKDIEKCAFKTPTGKWAQKLGYFNCKVLSLSQDEVAVDFIRDK